MRCFVIGLAAEVFICKHLCQETGGTYSIALDGSHFKELILEHCPPPPAIAEYVIANFIKMGFPRRENEGSVAICTCHEEAKTEGGYTCPRCKVCVCELPTEFRIYGLTLISSPHLARSYHHLLLIVPFVEISSSFQNDPSHRFPNTCFGYEESLLSQGNKPELSVYCPNANNNSDLIVTSTLMRTYITAQFRIKSGEIENQKIIKSEYALTIIEFLNCQLINFIPITKFSNRDNNFNYLEPAN